MIIDDLMDDWASGCGDVGSVIVVVVDDDDDVVVVEAFVKIKFEFNAKLFANFVWFIPLFLFRSDGLFYMCWLFWSLITL